MPPDDWRKLMIKRARPENAEPEEADEELQDAVDIQLERALDVLKGIMIFQAENRHSQMMASR